MGRRELALFCTIGSIILFSSIFQSRTDLGVMFLPGDIVGLHIAHQLNLLELVHRPEKGALDSTFIRQQTFEDP